MCTRRWTPGLAPLLLTLAPLIGGCATAMAPGEAIVEHRSGNPETPIEAPSDGEYALYPKFGSTHEKHKVRLRRGDLLGFRTAKTGEINAIAGEHEWRMTDNDYVWMRK